MSSTAQPPRQELMDAQTDLVRLNAQVTAMRATLAQLLQDIVVAETRLERSQVNRLIEANEHLVISALRAQTVADTAAVALDEASRLGGLDALTGLPNRTVLLDRFETAISNAKRHGTCVALLFIDLDAFKQINDTFGHACGDRALQLVADCLATLVRETDTVSRHGGDEFIVLLAEVAGAADAAVVAGKVNGALAAHLNGTGNGTGNGNGDGTGNGNGTGWQLRASIGISVYPEDGDDAKTLIANADAAMYQAKKSKAGDTVFYRSQHLEFPQLPRAHPTQSAEIDETGQTSVARAVFDPAQTASQSASTVAQ